MITNFYIKPKYAKINKNIQVDYVMNVAPQETIKSSGDENSIQTGYYAKEAKENPKETKELP